MPEVTFPEGLTAVQRAEAERVIGEVARMDLGAGEQFTRLDLVLTEGGYLFLHTRAGEYGSNPTVRLLEVNSEGKVSATNGAVWRTGPQALAMVYRY